MDSVEIDRGRSSGPRPAPSSPVTGLSRSRAALLETLRGQSSPTSIAALAAHTGLHENTLRGHLEGLEQDGLVTRRREAPEGRGRPAWLWSAVGSRPSEYAGLAAALATAIQRTSSDPAADAALAGRDWGRTLVRDRPARPSGSRALVRDLMVELDFGPVVDEAADGPVRLTRCPLLEVARRHTDVVCSVHAGLAAGALEESGDTATEVVLEPFAEPGACLLHLRADRT